MSKTFKDIKIGDVVWARDECGHDLDLHQMQIDTKETEEGHTVFFGTDLSLVNEDGDYDTDEYLTRVDESNFWGFDD